jgi:arylsulfatase A-like enzyme
MKPALLFLSLALLAGTHSFSQTKPNFVFIIADDLGWADVGFHGARAPTPHLDRLAREGLELAQHYVFPVCSPTRATLLSGRYCTRFGITSPHSGRALPWDTITLPRALKDAGYDTCLTGKWHLGSVPEEGPNHFGFDHSYGSLGGGVGPWDHRYKEGKFTRTWHRNEKLLVEEGHVTDLITAEAVNWIAQRGQRPFFLYLPFTAVHLPIKEPKEWLNQVPPTITGDVARQYAACIMHLDDSVGQIISALEKHRHRENTLVVFTSDNGGSTAENAGQTYPPDDYPTGKLPGDNRPLRGEKGQLYEGGIRVPTVASWPGKLKPGVFSQPLGIADWMPTFCALATHKPGKDLKWDGKNIWPLLSGGSAATPRTLYWAGPGFKTRAIREGDWKLIITNADKGKAAREELFDLSRDAEETNDLANQMQEKVTALKTVMSRVSKADRDSVAKD